MSSDRQLRNGPADALSMLNRGVAGNARRSGTSLSLAAVHPLLRPALRAYLIGYASAVGPRLLTLVLQHLSRRRKKTCQSYEPENGSASSFLDSASHIVRTGFDVQRFPTFCAVLVGGTTLLNRPLQAAISRLFKGLSNIARLRLARWLSTFISAWFGLQLLQSKHSPAFTKLSGGSDGSTTAVKPGLIRLGGRTMDLTLFTATRALDVIVGELWSRHRIRRIAAQKWTKVEQLATNFVDPLVFAVSCAFIMWSWFYHPDRLPRSYNKWITSAAMVDLRLIEALRRCRTKELFYGEETGQAPLLGGMCSDYKLPLEWGDPAKTVPFPCEIVHMGCGSSCEYHALDRFVRSWKWAMYTYLPLALALKLRKPSRKNLVLAFISASRSSVFLGTFITLFYYGVCLGRTRVGPRVLGKDHSCRQRIDGGVCVGTGCFLCGWSVLIETAGRRKDMALFVAPRALATVVPRRYPIEKQWQENLAFSASAAIIMTCVLENPQRVRGVLGGLLNMVVKT